MEHIHSTHRARGALSGAGAGAALEQRDVFAPTTQCPLKSRASAGQWAHGAHKKAPLGYPSDAT